MNKIDLIIENIEYSRLVTEQAHKDELLEEALAAARELKALKPAGYMDKKGLVFNDTTHPHLYTALYTLDEVTK
jgi:hypothetical protein